MYHRHLRSRIDEDRVVWGRRVRMVAIDLEDPAVVKDALWAL